MPLPRIQPAGRLARRELYYFALYRLLEAALLALMIFSPESYFFGQSAYPELGYAITLSYLPISGLLLLWAHQGDRLRLQAMVGASIDILAAGLAAHALPPASPVISMLLLFNIGAAALLLPLRYGMALAGLAAASLLGEYAWVRANQPDLARPLAERLMFAISYCMFALLAYQLNRQVRRSQAIAQQRSAEVADLAALNELIIRRMRTGVLLVDAGGRIRLANEAALALLRRGDGDPDLRELDLEQAAPELAARLRAWRDGGECDDAPLPLAGGQVETLPRFARLLASSQSTLIFLDDATQVSRRAESLTLAAMGRFSASLAHEVRNPLAAISYSAQLLEESAELAEADRNLVQIIHQQVLRTNTVIESVLGLARRERAQPEYVDLGAFVRRFVNDYRKVTPADAGRLEANAPGAPLAATIDPRHLQQVLTVLVQNAFNHGHAPGEPARITVTAHLIDDAPAIDVLDRGPGIPEGVRAQLFRPFFTTSQHGTGLGLYIAGELCRANQASLDHVPTPGVGGCFRIVMAAPHSLLDS